ncbi:MAG: ABC transporter ATP-binding protein [Pseudomonadota bacterium]|nr:ABC transporter ATP-binding protein [Pseudomonadota bacterium]
MIELHDVRKAFHQGQPNEYWALNGITLSLALGQVTALHGASGSGKTTLLTVIGGLARPTSGRVRLGGQDISGLPERFLTALRRQRFGFVFQQFNLIAGLSALDNVLLPAYPLGLPRAELVARARALLEGLEMGHRLHAAVQTLSGGEQQRVAIARALVNQPDILIADEPTANLDTALSQQLLDILARLHAQGTTIILSSHDPRVLDSGLVQRRVALRDGRVVNAGQGG